jgi:hypothetical protein
MFLDIIHGPVFIQNTVLFIFQNMTSMSMISHALFYIPVNRFGRRSFLLQRCEGR